MEKIDTIEWVRSTFIKLTSKTYPFGFEDGLVDDMIKCGLFPKDLKKDQFGNYFYKIGNSRTVFASHLDTACQDQVDVVHEYEYESEVSLTGDVYNEIIKTDGRSILGADDKAGVTILLWLMKNNIPGVYYFFYGEEVGCLGSTAASGLVNEFSNYDRIVSFDRRGLGSVITHQSSTRTCSDEFAQSLSDELNKHGLFYKKDDTGVYTDSAEFVNIIPECTNISVGYYSEHTTNEKQDITHLSKLADAVVLINWEILPTVRDKTKKEYKSYSWSGGYSSSCSSLEERLNDTYQYNLSRMPKKRTYLDQHDMDHEDVADFETIQKYSRNNRVRVRKKGRTFYGSGKDLRLIEDEIDDNDTYKDTIEKLDRMGHHERARRIEESLNDSPFDEDKRFYNCEGKYDILRSKFLYQDLSKEDLDVIRDQYLDMNDPGDVRYYGYLISTYVKSTRSAIEMINNV